MVLATLAMVSPNPAKAKVPTVTRMSSVSGLILSGMWKNTMAQKTNMAMVGSSSR